jgi:hypothetical protein
MSEVRAKESPSGRQVMLSALGFIGAFLLFVLILYVSYVPDRSPTVDHSYREARKAGIEEVRIRQLDLISTYGWIDREMGVVRVPVDRAMELVVNELGAETGALANPEAETQGQGLASTGREN